MGTETIELLKGYAPEKMSWPAGLQQKFDGVPVFIQRTSTGTIAFTRQGEVVKSINHILDYAKVLLPHTGSFVVGELYDPSLPFKTISGQVRDTKAQHGNLGLWVFDADMLLGSGHPRDPRWEPRRQAFIDQLADLAGLLGMAVSDLPIRSIPTITVYSSDEAMEAHAALMLANPTAEGSVLHAHDKAWSPGKRCWGTQRIKDVPTIDLLVLGYDEAISATGRPLGMVGRIRAAFSSARNGSLVTTEIGIGPGAMAHTERRSEFLKQTLGRFKPRIAEIRYMRDDTYDALRQPTFSHWRDDKAYPDVQAAS